MLGSNNLRRIKKSIQSMLNRIIEVIKKKKWWTNSLLIKKKTKMILKFYRLKIKNFKQYLLFF